MATNEVRSHRGGVNGKPREVKGLRMQKRCHPTPPLASLASTLPLKGRDEHAGSSPGMTNENHATASRACRVRSRSQVITEMFNRFHASPLRNAAR